jgi:hypothetical protein
MSRFLRIILAAGAMSAAATAANADVITWNFGTSGYSLTNPIGGPNAANASGTTGAITANGQGAIFEDTGSLFSPPMPMERVTLPSPISLRAMRRSPNQIITASPAPM